MLIRVRKSHQFKTNRAIGLPRPQALGNTTSTFSKNYLRPNLSNEGTTPAAGPYSCCPDIWIAGTSPISNFQSVLATADSYASSSSSNLYIDQTNVVYVRGKNGAQNAETNTVTLYYSPSGVIQSPSKWQGNIIKTDTGMSQGNLGPVASGDIGVCDATFTWESVPPPPSGSDHYCLFAQFNDANNSNPFPDVSSPLDMGSLIMNNLGWGWRNVSMVYGNSPTWSYSEPMTIPADFPTTNYYSVMVTPTGFVGWDVEFTCSQNDANGNPIVLKRTKITQDGQLLGASNCLLDPGFSSIMTVNLYAPSGVSAPTPGSSCPLSCNYTPSAKANSAEYKEALERGLIDIGFMHRLYRSAPELLRSGIGPTLWIVQGSYTGVVSNSANAFRN